MKPTLTRRSFVSGAAATMLAATGCAQNDQQEAAPRTNSRVDDLMAHMSLEQKVAQMVMPEVDAWKDRKDPITDLADVPGLAKALRRHQYGGVILFGSNIEDSEQTVRLVSDLQKNNARGDGAKETSVIPYFVAADQEGGSVARLNMGTRGTGSMALGATGDAAVQNARDTGALLGTELAALGINVNLGPCVDVITDLTDQGMSTRVFSDDPETVQQLSQAFAEGVSSNGVVTCFKHFPGAGDGSDYPTAINITLDELKNEGLVPYSAVIEDGAEMVMMSATTFPGFDDKHVLADGKTEGYYPASMSEKIVGTMLRNELGFTGVVMTDALLMEQFVTEPDTNAQLVAGEPHSPEAGVNIAVQCINAGCDVLLMPSSFLDDGDQWFEDYLAGIIAKVKDGTVNAQRIDDAVRRILTLKDTYGVLDIDMSDKHIDRAVSTAQKVVGCEEHHATERSIAEQAITLLKDEGVLPVPGEEKRIVILGRTTNDANPIGYALSELTDAGILDPDAHVVNDITGETTGEESAKTHIFIGHYYNATEDKLEYSDKNSEAIKKSDYTICLSATMAGLEQLQDSSPRVQGVLRALSETSEVGGRFVLLSDNLPVDSARFTEANAIVCAYLSAGFDVDPTTSTKDENMRAVNANVPAALRAIFGMVDMPGMLPIDIYALEQDSEGAWGYTDKVLYKRGSGGEQQL